MKKLVSTMAYLTVDQLKAMIWMNHIKNNPVTLADVDLVEKVYRKDVMAIKNEYGEIWSLSNSIEIRS